MSLFNSQLPRFSWLTPQANVYTLFSLYFHKAWTSFENRKILVVVGFFPVPVYKRFVVTCVGCMKCLFVLALDRKTDKKCKYNPDHPYKTEHASIWFHLFGALNTMTLPHIHLCSCLSPSWPSWGQFPEECTMARCLSSLCPVVVPPLPRHAPLPPNSPSETCTSLDLV